VPHGPRHLRGPDRLGRGDERRPGGALENVRARLHRDQARRGRHLVYLGLHALHAAIRPRGESATVERNGGRRLPPRAAFRQGLISNLGNPKIAAFFTSLLPQFRSRGSSFAALLLLGLVFCLQTLAWLSAYAVAVAKAGNVLSRPPIRRALDAITGTILVAFGVRLATEHR
jgi:threonine/homoserine/homoserine lactone efflux protein